MKADRTERPCKLNSTFKAITVFCRVLNVDQFITWIWRVQLKLFNCTYLSSVGIFLFAENIERSKEHFIYMRWGVDEGSRNIMKNQYYFSFVFHSIYHGSIKSISQFSSLLYPVYIRKNLILGFYVSAKEVENFYLTRLLHKIKDWISKSRKLNYMIRTKLKSCLNLSYCIQSCKSELTVDYIDKESILQSDWVFSLRVGIEFHERQRDDLFKNYI